MGGRKVIKIEDRTLRDLADRIAGYKRILDEIALRYYELNRIFWEEAKKKYGVDLEKKRYWLDHASYEIIEDD